jgi:hypothetical protein
LLSTPFTVKKEEEKMSTNNLKLAVYFTGDNAAGKTALLSLFVHAMKEAGFPNVKISGPDDTPESVLERYQHIAKCVRPDTQIEVHELYNMAMPRPGVVQSALAASAQDKLKAYEDLFDRVIDFMESPNVHESILRASLTADIKKALGRV